MAEASERARLKSVTFHALRHTWASAAAMAGVPMSVIAANLGHAGRQSRYCEALRAFRVRLMRGTRSAVAHPSTVFSLTRAA